MTRHACRLRRQKAVGAVAAAGLLAAASIGVAAAQAEAGIGARPVDGMVASPTAPPTASDIASHRGFLASHLLDAKFHDGRGRALGSVQDIVVDMCNGEVRHAVLAVDDGWLPGGGRQIEVPVSAIHGTVVGAIESRVDRLVIDFDARELAGLPAAGASADARAPCSHRVSARDLLGRDLFGANGRKIGKLSDLVISMDRARVNFAVLQFDPDPGPPDRLLAFPLQMFDLEADGRLVIALGAPKLRQLPGFVASGWPHVLTPDELSDVDRQFIADFPDVWDKSPRTLFEHLDVDQNGTLSASEVLVHAGARDQFATLDRDDDRRLSKPEFVLGFEST